MCALALAKASGCGDWLYKEGDLTDYWVIIFLKTNNCFIKRNIALYT
jgi:hypothetical protein